MKVQKPSCSLCEVFFIMENSINALENEMLTDKKSLLLYIKRIFYLIYIDFDYTVQLGKQRSIEHTLGFNYKYTHILKSSKLHSNTQTVQIIEQERL